MESTIPSNASKYVAAEVKEQRKCGIIMEALKQNCACKVIKKSKTRLMRNLYVCSCEKFICIVERQEIHYDLYSWSKTTIK